MDGTLKNTEQVSAEHLGEEALLISIDNTNLNRSTTRALRLTSKRTKATADAKVKAFKMVGDQEPEAVQRSGLLSNIIKLDIRFNLNPSGFIDPNATIVSRCLDLLQLAADVCSKSLEVLDVKIHSPVVTFCSSARILGDATWESLKELWIDYSGYPMLGFLSDILASPTRLPALQTLNCNAPTAYDLESLHNSPIIGSLTHLSLSWHYRDFATNTAPATMAAMRSLLQKATNLKSLSLESHTFEFFDSENLISLESLKLTSPLKPYMAVIAFNAALARPWLKLKSLDIGAILIHNPDHLVRIFESKDTLPVLSKLKITSCAFSATENAPMSCVRRPHLEEFSLVGCQNSHKLLFELAQLMKEDTYALPSLKNFLFNCAQELSMDSVREAISKFLSCPCMTPLEMLAIHGAGGETARILFNIVNCCPKLKRLDLRKNKLGLDDIFMLSMFGEDQGAWPELQELEGIVRNRGAMDEEEMEMQEDLRRAWPGLVCT